MVLVGTTGTGKTTCLNIFTGQVTIRMKMVVYHDWHQHDDDGDNHKEFGDNFDDGYEQNLSISKRSPAQINAQVSTLARMVWGNFSGKNLLTLGVSTLARMFRGTFFRDEVPQSARLSAGEGCNRYLGKCPNICA